MNNQDSPNGGSYRAAQGNLNTVISNPSVNINDTMNMNIQNMNHAYVMSLWVLFILMMNKNICLLTTLEITMQ